MLIQATFPIVQVQEHIMTFLQVDSSGATARATRAVLHWQNLQLAAAFSSWSQQAQDQALERLNDVKAAKFLHLALLLKALTGFKSAVQEAHIDRAAIMHRGGATKRTVLRAWRQVVWYLQVHALLWRWG